MTDKELSDFIRLFATMGSVNLRRYNPVDCSISELRSIAEEVLLKDFPEPVHRIAAAILHYLDPTPVGCCREIHKLGLEYLGLTCLPCGEPKDFKFFPPSLGQARVAIDMAAIVPWKDDSSEEGK